MSSKKPTRYQAAVIRSAELWIRDKKKQVIDCFLLEFYRGAVDLSPSLFVVVWEDLANILSGTMDPDHRHALVLEIREFIKGDPSFKKFRWDVIHYVSTFGGDLPSG